MNRSAFTPLGLKENEAEARQRHRAFFAGESLSDRPALYVVADAGADAASDAAPEVRAGIGRDAAARKRADLNPAWHIARIDAELRSTVYLADAMPAAGIMIGTDVTDTAVLLGGDYDYVHGEAIIRRDIGVLEASVPVFDPLHPFVRAVESVYERVAEHVGRTAYVNTVMTLDALTTISQLAGPLDFCRDLVRRPDWVVDRIKATTHLMADFYEHIYGLLLRLGHGESSAWFHCVAEGRFDCVRCDIAVMLSPTMFETFAVPELRLQTDYLDHSLFNMDSTCMMRFLDSLAALPGLDGIFWNPEPARADLYAWVDELREIRRRGLIVEVMASDANEACFIARELGPDGLLIALPRFSSTNEAEAAIEAIARSCRRHRSSRTGRHAIAQRERT